MKNPIMTPSEFLPIAAEALKEIRTLEHHHRCQLTQTKDGLGILYAECWMSGLTASSQQMDAQQRHVSNIIVQIREVLRRRGARVEGVVGPELPYAYYIVPDDGADRTDKEREAFLKIEIPVFNVQE